MNDITGHTSCYHLTLRQRNLGEIKALAVQCTRLMPTRCLEKYAGDINGRTMTATEALVCVCVCVFAFPV